jgi:ribonuclease P protein component
MSVGQRFPKGVRLRRRSEFLAAQEHPHGRKFHTRFFLVIVAPREALGRGRLGITVSKKVGNAVTRNRIRRLVREVVRVRADWLPEGRDVVVIAKKNAGAIAGLADVAGDLDRLSARFASC